MSIKSPLSRQFGSRFDSVFDVVKSNPVYDKAGRIPTLDLNFAKSKSLYDGRSTKNLIDHVRDTAPNSSTYVDAAGLIKRSVTNTVVNSEDFTNWSKTNTSVSSNQINAPDGTLTADKVIEDATLDNHYVQSAIISFTGPTDITGSVYLKKGERIYARLRLNTAEGPRAWFNLETGTRTAIDAAAADATITDVGNGWYRCTLTQTNVTTAPSLTLQVFAQSLSGTQTTYQGDGTSGLYVWGAQVEEASTVGEYVKTTATKSSAPRFDHDPATGESLGLLVEESRTNLLLYSEQLDEQSTWTDVGTTWSANSIIAPDGTQTADNPGFVSAKWGFYDATNASWISGYPQNYPFTVTSEWVRHPATITTPSGCTSLRFYPLRNSNDTEYVYQTVTVTESTTYTVSAYYKLADDGTTVIVWGAQLEEGSFSTSYIPTEGAAVTRGADIASISGTNFSGFYNQSEGTVFSISRHKAVTARNLAFTDGTPNNALQQYLLASQAAMDSYVSGSWQGSGAASITFVADQQFKLASTIQENSGVTAADGVLGTLDDSYGIPTVDRLNIGQSRASDVTTGTIRHLTYWDTRLSNEKLQSTTA